jgi:hypothetical protein
MVRRGDVGETGAVKRAHQKITGAADTVAREHTSGAIRPVRGGGETDEQHPRARIAEAGHRPAPVRVAAIRAPLLARNRRAVLAQPRTALAGHNRVAHDNQRRRRSWLVVRRSSHVVDAF